MQVDVAINALGRPYQTFLGVATLLKYNAEFIDRIYLIIDADTPDEEKDKFSIIREHYPDSVELVRSEYAHGYFDNITGPFDDETYRMGIRYQYAWEKSASRFLFVTHNDTSFTGPVVEKMLDAIEDNIIIGQLGVCWNCPAHWAGKCSRGQYASYKPSYNEVYELYTTTQAPVNNQYDFGYHRTNFNEKWRTAPWPLPHCRVHEWCCLINLEAAKKVTVPHGPATPFGATTYIGEIMVDTACEWFHDVMNMGFTAKDFPIEDYFIHRSGISQSFDRVKYLLSEKQAIEDLRELGII